MLEPFANLIQSRPRSLYAVRCCALVYLAVVLGAGAALRSVHLGSAKHVHRYCPEHDRVEVFDGRAGSEDADPPEPPASGVRAGAGELPRAHVACALLSALANRAPVTASAASVATPVADAARFEIELVTRFTTPESILSLAPKTSPPIASA